jgi:mannose-6-phosphate isomerase-like protein (cupin superfamily)
VLGPSVFTTTWAYIDHVLVPPGASTPELAHESVGEAYYVLAGTGTLTVKGSTSETAPVRMGDALPIRLGETSLFTNTGSEPLELFVMGVARDMAAKTQLLTGSAAR